MVGSSCVLFCLRHGLAVQFRQALGLPRSSCLWDDRRAPPHLAGTVGAEDLEGPCPNLEDQPLLDRALLHMGWTKAGLVWEHSIRY